MTKVINLLGGPGSGKTTNAALLFGTLKNMGIQCEYATEYVKEWAWQDRQVGELDQLYIFGKQARKEYTLFNKVDYIITDSPVFLSAFYEEKYYDHTIVKSALPEYIKTANKLGVEYINFVINRTKEFNPKGRYETEEQSKIIDNEIVYWLDKNDYEFIKVNDYKDILSSLGVSNAN